MASSKENIIDITKTGPLGFRQLQAQNDLNQSGLGEDYLEYVKNIQSQFAPISMFDPNANADQKVQSQLADTNVPWGKSIFDEGVANEEQFQHLGDIRAENEPWYAKVSAGIVKGAITAGTTFVDGTLGLLCGFGTVAQNYNEGKRGGEAWSGIWNNDVTQAMQKVTDWSEETMPNYYTEGEQNTPWYTPSNIFTANFLGDKLIKQAGFMIGAAWAGKVWAAPAALLGQGLAEAISGISSTVREVAGAPVVTSQLIGSVFSAVNEGSIEALNNSRDWANLQKQQIEDKCREEAQKLYQEYMVNAGQHFIQTDRGMVDAAMLKYEQEIQKLESTYNETVSQIDKDAALMGNKDLLLNIPILTIGNWVQFGKLFAGKYGQNKALSVVKDEATGKFIPTMTRGKALGIAAKDATAEGLEELTQNMASNVSGLYYENDVNNFYRKQFDPEAVDNVMDWWDAAARGICETLGDANAWEEFTIGAIMGAFGVPSLRSMRTESGGWQSPFRMESGAFASYREAMETLGLQQRDADVMNKAMENPNFMTALQNIIREKGFENAMAQALKKRRKHIESANFEDENNEAEEGEPFSLGDKFDYKNAEFGQLVSGVLAFERTGNLDALREIINNAYDTSDERNYEALIKNTTREEERNGKKEFIGPFVDSEGNPLSKEEVDKQVETVKDAINIAIDDIIDIKNDLDAKSGRSITGDQLDELVWMKAQIHDWSRRSSEMAGELKATFTAAREALTALKEAREKEGNKDQVEKLDSWIKTIDLFSNMPPQMLGAVLYEGDKKQRDEVLNIIDMIPNGQRSKDEKEKAKQDLQDLYRAAARSDDFSKTFDKYFNNPDLHRADHARIRQEAQDDYDRKAVNDFYNRLAQAKTVQEVDRVLESSEGVSPETIQRALDKFEKSGSPIAKNWRNISTYRTDVYKALNESKESDQAKNDAAMLLNYFAIKTNLRNAEELSDSQNAVLNSPTTFMEALEVNPDELTPEERDALQQRWYDARYALTEAMNKVNRANNKKNGLRKPVPSPQKKGYNRGTLFTRSGKTIETKELSDITDDNGTRTITFGESVDGEEVQESKDAGIKLHEDEVDWEDSYKMDASNISDNIKNSQKAHKIIINSDGIFAETPEGKRLTLLTNPLDDINRLRSKAVDDYESPGDQGDKVPTTVIIETSGTQTGEITDDNEPAYGAESDDKEFTKHEMEDEAKQSEDMEFMGDSDEGKTDEDGNMREYYVTAIPYFLPEQARLGNFALFPEIESKGDYKLVFNYLVSKGAFKYVEDGKLKRGAGISFMIDPAHEAEKAKSENLKNSDPTIFMVETSTGQVVGVLDASERAERTYEGLADLRASIIQQYNEWKKEQDKKSKDEKEETFKAKETTSVNEIKNGKIPYGNEEFNIGTKDSKGNPIIPNILTEEDGKTPKEPLLAVVAPLSYEGGAGGFITLNTGKKSGLSVRSPKEGISNKKGNIYLLVPTPDGRYAVVALRTKHLNENEFDLTDPANVVKGSLGAAILSNIEKMVSVKSQEELLGVLKQLKNFLHLAPIEIEYENADDHSPRLKFRRKTGNTIERESATGTTTQIAEKEPTQKIFLDNRNTDSGKAKIVQKIIKQLNAFNLPIQVSAKMLNGKSFDGKTGYNRWLIESGVFTTNLTKEYGARMVGSWFTTNPILNGTEQKKYAPLPYVRRVPPKSTVPGTVVYTRKGEKYYVDGDTIRDKNGKVLGKNDISDQKRQLLKDIADTDKRYTVYTEIPGLLSGNKCLITRKNSNTVIFDRSSQTYENDKKKVDAFKNKLKKQGSPVKGRNISTAQALSEINENQKLVRKNEDGGNFTDEKGYRIDDGKGNGENKNEYVRVHSIIGSGWKEETESVNPEEIAKQEGDVLRGIGKDTQKFDAYLNTLIQRYGLDEDIFDSIKGRPSKMNANTAQILLTNALEQQAKEKGENPNRDAAKKKALETGNAIDTVVRHFFQVSDKTKIKNPNPKRLTDGENGTFRQLLSILSEIEEEMKKNGEHFHSNNIVVWHKYADGTAVAGELDILVTDDKGNFKIYDIKTSMYPFTGKGNYFDNKYRSAQERPTREQYALQLSAYKNLFESQYGIPIQEIKIIPFKLSYNDVGEVTNILYEGIIDLTKDYVSPVGIPNEMQKQRVTTTSTSPKVKEDKQEEKKEDTVIKTLHTTDKLRAVGYKVVRLANGRVSHGIYLRTPDGHYMVFAWNEDRNDGTHWDIWLEDNQGKIVKTPLSLKGVRKNITYLDKKYREFYESGRADELRKRDEEEGSEDYPLELEKEFGITQRTLESEPAQTETKEETETEETEETEETAEESQTDDEINEGIEKSLDDLDSLEGDDPTETGEYSIEGEESTTPSTQPKFELNKSYGINTAEKLFNDLVDLGDDVDVTKELAKRVFAVARKLGLKIIFTDKLKKSVKGNYENTNIIRLNYDFFNSNKPDKRSAEILLHEVIHSVTMYALSDYMQEHLSPALKTAADELKAIYKELRESGELNNMYGMRAAIDMVAELSNSTFRERLIEYQPSIWERIKNAILSIFSPGVRRTSNVYRRLNSALDSILTNFDLNTYNSYIVTSEEILSGVGNERGIDLNESASYTNPEITYDSLPQDVQDELKERGVSKEEFDSKPDAFKEAMLECIGFL